MICPSCNTPSDLTYEFCIRCGFNLGQHGRFLSKLRGSATWVLRRSLAGMSTGLVGWFVIPAAARAAGATFPQWGHLLLSGAIGGFFLGIVEGMVEESAIKTVRGGVFGAIGGLMGGLAGTLVLNMFNAGMPAVVLAWGLTGSVIGASSVWLERRPDRILMGFVAGLIGGALGGWLGYQMYASLGDMVKTDSWVIKRGIEGTTGAVLGAVLWVVVGTTEKLWIFKRRVATNISYKECEICEHSNVLKAWYCAGCGSLLQVSAPPEKLQLTKREALARVVGACKFLAQLCAMTGVVVACLTAGFLSTINLFLGLFGFLTTSLIAYLLYTLLYAITDGLSPWLELPAPGAPPKNIV
jgi:hypothetical protein